MKKYIIFPNGQKLRYSSRIECTPENVEDELTIYIGNDPWGVPYATTNMQNDYADFEGIVFAVWSILPKCNITLKYEQLKWYLTNGNFPIDYSKVDEKVLEAVNKHNAETYINQMKNDEEKGEKKERTLKIANNLKTQTQHYMRFLYRVMQMLTHYGEYFRIADVNKREVELFTRIYNKAFEERKLIMTEPAQTSNIKGVKHVTENHLEKWFMLYSNDKEKGRLIPDFVKKCGNMKLYDQFPCGLFYKNKRNRIFNKGAFDLWGIDAEGAICLFELKEKSNHSLGIISELFFYSCLIKDLKVIACNSKKVSDFRGYDIFKGANGGIKAFFLTPRLYSFMEEKDNLENILNSMNKRNDGVVYDNIIFEQDKIVGFSEEKFIEELKNKISKEHKLEDVE